MVELIRSEAIFTDEPTYAQRRGMFVQALARLMDMYASSKPRLLPVVMKVEIVRKVGQLTGATLHTLVIYGASSETQDQW